MNDFQKDFAVIAQNCDFPSVDGEIVWDIRNIDRIMKNPVEIMPISVRGMHTLKRNGIFTVANVFDKLDQLRQIARGDGKPSAAFQGCGKGTAKNICSGFLAAYYAELSDKERKEFWANTYEKTYDLIFERMPKQAQE